MANTQNPVVPSLEIRQLATLRYDLGSAFPAGTVVQIVGTCMTPQFQTQYEVFEPSADAPDGATRNRAANTLYYFVKIHVGTKLSFVHTKTSGIKRNTISSEYVEPLPGVFLAPDGFAIGDMVRLKQPLIDHPRTRFPTDLPTGLNISRIPAGTVCFLNGYASQTDDALHKRAVLRDAPRYELIFAVKTPSKDYLAYGRALPAHVFRPLSPNDPAYGRWQHDESTRGLGVPKIVSATRDMSKAALDYLEVLNADS